MLWSPESHLKRVNFQTSMKLLRDYFGPLLLLPARRLLSFVMLLPWKKSKCFVWQIWGWGINTILVPWKSILLHCVDTINSSIICPQILAFPYLLYITKTQESRNLQWSILNCVALAFSNRYLDITGIKYAIEYDWIWMSHLPWSQFRMKLAVAACWVFIFIVVIECERIEWW